MKILFAPSESKNVGGTERFDIEGLCFGKKLLPARQKALESYAKVLRSGDTEKIAQLTGLKKGGQETLPKTTADFAARVAMPAVARYSGVAYDALDFASLSVPAQNYLRDNLLIFSNLFGVLGAFDAVPNYKLKQGCLAGDTDTAALYREHLQQPLDDFLQGECVLDLRAGFYDKFYKPKVEFSSILFLKNGKAVSHFAKHYRGLVLRECAERQIKTVDELVGEKLQGNLQNLSFREARKTKNKMVYIFEILE